MEEKLQIGSICICNSSASWASSVSGIPFLYNIDFDSYYFPRFYIWVFILTSESTRFKWSINRKLASLNVNQVLYCLRKRITETNSSWELFNVNGKMQNSLFFCLLMLLSIMKLSLATDVIAPGQSITDGETLVSSSQSFELGFFSLGNSKNRFLGIWYWNIPEAVVWVANRNNPLADENGVLTIDSDGNLVLFDGTNTTVWPSNVSRKAEGPVGQLLDSGNFVVKDNKTMQEPVAVYLWQSFDYLTDTLLPGMKLGKNLKTGSEWNLTSWTSAEDPSPGNFTCRFSIQGITCLVIYFWISENIPEWNVGWI